MRGSVHPILATRYAAVVDDAQATARSAPPDDPDDWTNEQWIAWLNETDADAIADRNNPPATVAGRVVHSSAGQVLGQTMIGLAQAIYGPRRRAPIVIKASSEPDEDRAFSLHLDFDSPEDSTVVLHPDREPPA
jgi:hypothetical protein